VVVVAVVAAAAVVVMVVVVVVVSSALDSIVLSTAFELDTKSSSQLVPSTVTKFRTDKTATAIFCLHCRWKMPLLLYGPTGCNIQSKISEDSQLVFFFFLVWLFLF
jgi:hypothetical protein